MIAHTLVRPPQAHGLHMNWHTKAKIQNSVALFPAPISYAVYYWLQRNFGALRSVNPLSRLSAGFETIVRLKDSGFLPIDKVFLEIGTSRRINTPLSFWLMGARESITVDLKSLSERRTHQR